MVGVGGGGVECWEEAGPGVVGGAMVVPPWEGATVGTGV